MKALDIPTNTIYDVVSINYDTNCVVLKSKDGCTKHQTPNNVRLLLDKDEDIKGKNIIHPEAFWMIPLVGWFMITYKLFYIKDCVIISDKLNHQLYILIASIGPILLYILFIYLSTI